MAAALLHDELARLGFAARVHSAGTLAWRGGASEGALTVMRERGIDLAGHASRRLDASLVEQADLVLGMTRAHVWAVGSHVADATGKAFLPAELARLGDRVGPRASGEAVSDWVARVAAQRGDHRVPGHPQDEVPDPAGEPLEVYRAIVARLAGESARVARLIGGPVGAPPAR